LPSGVGVWDSNKETTKLEGSENRRRLWNSQKMWASMRSAASAAVLLQCQLGYLGIVSGETENLYFHVSK
jgi:anti-sigma-K factor RskA